MSSPSPTPYLSHKWKTIPQKKYTNYFSLSRKNHKITLSILSTIKNQRSRHLLIHDKLHRKIRKTIIRKYQRLSSTWTQKSLIVFQEKKYCPCLKITIHQGITTITTFPLRLIDSNSSKYRTICPSSPIKITSKQQLYPQQYKKIVKQIIKIISNSIKKRPKFKIFLQLAKIHKNKSINEKKIT